MTAVSILVVADAGDPSRFAAMASSVDAQTVGEIETIVVTTPSTPRELVSSIATWGGGTHRIVESPAPGRSAALQVALASATADVVAWLESDATLELDAVEAVIGAIGAGADLVYCDHDRLGCDGRLVTAYKPDYSPERLRNHDYLTSFVAARRKVAMAAGEPDGDDAVVMHDLALRLTEHAQSIRHVPQVLVHLRREPGGIVAPSSPRTTPRDETCEPNEPNEPNERERRRVVGEHCGRVGIAAQVVAAEWPGIVRVARHVAVQPPVSVVIPTRGTTGEVAGTDRCFVIEAVRSLVEADVAGALEFVIVHDVVTPPEVLDTLRELIDGALLTVPFDEPFNFSVRMNAGVAAASGDLLLLLNDDTELIAAGSLDVMVAHLQAPDVAMVGAKLLFEDGTLQHGGHVYHHKIHHACFGWPGDSPGPPPLYPLAVERECSGVTAAAALVRRSAFEQVGGFDPAFPLNYNDVDLSLKLRGAGHRIVWTPHASWYHFESRTRTGHLRPDEVELVEAKWGAELRADRYYHPALSPDRGDWSPTSTTPMSASASAPESTAESTPVSTWSRARERVVRALVGPPSARPVGVNLIGYLDAASGLGDRARQLEIVLDAAGIRHSNWNLDVTDSDRIAGGPQPRPDDGIVFDTTIAVVTALALPGVEGVHPPLIRAVDRVIGYWFWELDDIPDSHRPGIDLVDEIWAPTRFVRNAYAAAVREPVELVPLPIPPPLPSAIDRSSFGFINSDFVFLTSFDHLSSMERKNPVGVVDAFGRAFPAGDEPVRLVVKSINGRHRPREAEQLAQAVARDDRIEVRDEYLDAADQAALIRSADAFVSLHRSEGLGLHIAEAMWLGTPVIATRYSGSLDLTERADGVVVAELVDAELVAVVDGGEAYQRGVWADPDLDQAGAAMRRLATDETLRIERATTARRHIESQFDVEEAAIRVAAALAERARPRSRRERFGAANRTVRRMLRAAIDSVRSPGRR